MENRQQDPGVCVVAQSVKGSNVIDPSMLERAGCYKVKVSLKCSADLIFSKSGNTVAFILLTGSDLTEANCPAWTR